MTRKRKAHRNKMPPPITIELTLTCRSLDLFRSWTLGQRERFVSTVMKKYSKE